MQGPPKIMGCLGGLAHGIKTTCNYLLNHVQPCTIKPWVFLGGLAHGFHGFKTMCTTNIFFADNSIFYFLLFFIILLRRNITTAPLYCVVFLTGIFYGR